MIRSLLRLLAMILLAVAVILGVLDATRSVAASRLVMTPLGENWQAGMPDLLDGSQAWVGKKLDPAVWDAFAASVLQVPGFAVFLLLALLSYALGRRPSRPVGRAAFQR